MSKNQDYKYNEEFGYIPKDWTIGTLGELGIEMLKGNGLSKDQLSDYGKYYCIHYGELFTFYKERIKNIRHKTNEGTVFSRINDVLMPSSDVTPTGLAKASCIESDNVVLGGDILVLRCKNIIDGTFLSYLIRRYKNRILQLVSGTTVYHIYPNDMKKFKISYPENISEQEKIAEVLSDMDSLIEKTQQLIEKKRNLKTAAMQKLLTPKDDWERKELDKVVNIDKGQQVNSNLLMNRGQFPVINGGIEPSGYLETFNTARDTITISEGGNSCGYVNYMRTPFWSGGHCYSLSNISSKIEKKYLFYFLKNKEIDIMNLRVGSGLPNIQRREISNFFISYPSQKEEQNKIALILSDIDNEIEILEHELTKYKDLKIGMMQELLTGKVRLI